MALRAVPECLRVVAAQTFAPRGPSFDPTALGRRLRALRGGPDGIAVALAWRTSGVLVSVLARGRCEPADVDVAIEAGRGLAGVDDDTTSFFEMIQAHPLLAGLARGTDPRLRRWPTVFEGFAAAVIGQLVTGYEAMMSWKRLWRVAGEAIDDTTIVAAPTARGVRAVPMWKLREMGIGSRRAATLRTGALRGPSLERLRRFDPETAIEKLMSLDGVGPWTANAVARDSFGWPDAVPIGDFHVPRLVTVALTGEEGGDAEMLEALEPFRPHRTRVVKLLERAHVAMGVGDVKRWKPPRVDPHRRTPWRG